MESNISLNFVANRMMYVPIVIVQEALGESNSYNHTLDWRYENHKMKICNFQRDNLLQ